ncbi:60S ribosomal protein L28 [Vanrija pseudolonga]|uniref:60S ribosomal protein L28 n=1 Tax=Vanrija pseudolonga TaxID=143232 RepID=A0AAF1BLH0_9TREE|nr:60S ribosomal protein L28 [Vanrija pseudolonga]
MSADLQWLLVRKWNSFQRKAVNGPVFSAEKGNLVNLHSGKYSGLANNKVIDISATPEGAIKVTKITADGRKVASTQKSTTLRRSTGPRRANKIAAVETASKGFRADLRPAAVARASALSRAARRSVNPPKDFPIKTRGKKAVVAEENAIEVD